MKSAMKSVTRFGDGLNLDGFCQIHRNCFGQLGLKFTEIKAHAVAGNQDGGVELDRWGRFFKRIGVR